MIGRLRGKPLPGSRGTLLLDVGGVGYKVLTTPELRVEILKRTDEVSLSTYLAVRDDALELYGFRNDEELSFFEQLLSVSGIGPKSALTLLAVGDLSMLRKAIGNGDVSYLTKVSGIGKKTAERIIVELRDKIWAGGSAEEVAGLRQDVDVLEALKSLGYSGKEAREAVMKIGREGMNTNEKLKAALKELGVGV